MSGSVRMVVSRTDYPTYSKINWTFYARGNGVSWNSSASYTISGATSASGTFNLRADTTERVVASGSFNVNRGGSAQSKTVTGKLTSGTSDFGTQTASGSTTVPALPTYTVTLNNNGSTSTLTKTHNVTLDLPTPTRTNYTFRGWKASDDVTYQGTYDQNAAITLTALWELDKRPPVIDSITAERLASSPSNIRVSIDFTNGDGGALTSLQIKYRPLGSTSSFTVLTSFTNQSSSPLVYTSTNSAFSETQAYEILVVITDQFFSGLESHAQVSKYGYIARFGKTSSGAQTIDFNGDVNVNSLKINDKSVAEIANELLDNVRWNETVVDGWYCTQSPEGMLTMRKRVAVTFGNTWSAVGGHYRAVKTVTLPFEIPYEDRIEMSGMAGASGMLAFVNSDNQSTGTDKIELIAYKETSGNATYTVNMSITVVAKTNVELGDADTQQYLNSMLSEIENGSY